MSENRSTSPPKGRVGSQSVFGTKASLVANTVRARIGGRFAALHIPQSEAEKLERVAKDATEQRKLRALPEAGLSLEYAYGFNGRRCQNLYDLGQLSYCYSVAALGVVWDDEKKEQRIFQGHTAEITAMACCSRSRRIATGQKMAPGETTASILLWSAEELPVPSMRQQILGHNQAIYSIAFSADGRWLLSVAAEERGQKPSKNELKANASPLCAWRIDDMPAKGPARQIRAPQTRLPIREKVRLVSHPVDSTRVMAYGGRNVYFITCSWAAKDAAQGAKILTPTPPPPHDTAGGPFYGFKTGCFISGSSDLAVVGTDGGVFVIEAFSADGPVCLRGLAITTFEVRFLVPLSSGDVVCGGSGESILLLRSDLSSTKMKVAGLARNILDFATATQLESTAGPQILAGTVNGALCRIRMNVGAGYGSAELLQQSPSGRAEVKALCINPRNPNQVAVADSNGLIMFFDLDVQRLMDVANQFRAAVTAMTWDPTGLLLAVGLESGHLRCLVIGDLEAGRMSELDMGSLGLQETAAVTALCFSPGPGALLAVGYRDGRVQLLQVRRPLVGGTNGSTFQLAPLKVLQGNASAVLSLQFAKDGSALASNARDSAILCWDVETGKSVPSNFPPDVWFGNGHRFRLAMSWAMWGAWNKDSYRSTTAIIAESQGVAKLMAVGDEEGLVKLQRFPLFIPDALAKEHFGHCSRIAGLAWAGPDRLVTAGAGSCALLQWRLDTSRRKQEEVASRETAGAVATASVRSARSAGAVRRPATASGASQSSTARSKSQSSTGGPSRSRPLSGNLRSSSPTSRSSRQQRASDSIASVASTRPNSRSRASSRLRGTTATESRQFAFKARTEERFKDASVQTDLPSIPSMVTQRNIVTLAPPVNYANYAPGRFIAINQEAFGSWQAQSRPTSPIRYASPPRLVSMPPGFGQPLPYMSPPDAKRSPSLAMVAVSPPSVQEGSFGTDLAQGPQGVASPAVPTVYRYVSAASALAPSSPSATSPLRAQTPPPMRISPRIYQPAPAATPTEPVATLTMPPSRMGPKLPTPASTISACNSGDVSRLCCSAP